MRVVCGLGWGLVCVGLMLSALACRRSAEETNPETAAGSVSATAIPADVGDEPLVAEEGARLVELEVSGMHCDGCAGTIGRKLRTMEGVRQVRVSFNRNCAWLVVDAAAGSPRTEALVTAIEGLGYKASLRGGEPSP